MSIKEENNPFFQGEIYDGLLDEIIQICTDIYYHCETIKGLDTLTDKAMAVLDKAYKANGDKDNYVNGSTR